MRIVDVRSGRRAPSRWVGAMEAGDVDEIVIAGNGVPVARLVRVDEAAMRLGIAKVGFDVPEAIDRWQADIAIAHATAGEPAL